MKKPLWIICIALAVSCQKTPPDTTTADSTTVAPIEDKTVAAVPYKDDDPITLKQNGDLLELMIEHKKILSFKVPDSSKAEVSTGVYGNVVAEWQPKGLVTYKSFVFQFNKGYCNYPGDEGTSTELIDTLAHGPGFAHGTFNNLVAGAYGIEELYNVIYDGYCIQFNWVLGMSSDATPEDRTNEIKKIEEFLKTVRFEQE